MRLARKICFYLFAGIACLFTLALGFVAIRTLVSRDWALAENPVASAVGYGFRILFFVMVLVLLVTRIVDESRASGGMTPMRYVIFLFLVMGVACTFFFYDWFFALPYTISIFLTLVLSSPQSGS